MENSVKYSQNFLKSNELARELVSKSLINKNDTVIEVGPGTGVITYELMNHAKQVIAIEIDFELYRKLKARYSSVELIHANFITYELPSTPYKVFSNIPFNITARIIKKLTEAPNPPTDAYLIIQKEAALKYVGKSMLPILLKPWFEFMIRYEFKKTDFEPAPMVDTVLLQMKRRERPLVKDKDFYYDFIAYAYNQWAGTLQDNLKNIFTRAQFSRLANELKFPISVRVKELGFKQWLGIYDYLSKGVSEARKSMIYGTYARLLKQQSKLEKRTRTSITTVKTGAERRIYNTKGKGKNRRNLNRRN